MQEILAASKRSVFDTQFYAEKFLSWGMRNESLKVALFRFVDVLPSLPDASSVVRHVQEYFSPLHETIPDFLRKAIEIKPNALAAKLASAAIRKQVGIVAENFIVGATPEAALKPLRKLRKAGQAFTVDLLGEATVSEAEAKVYLDRYLSLLSVLAREVPQWPESRPLIAGHPGEETPVNISVKLSALYSQARPLNTEQTERMFVERLSPILRAAKGCGAFVYVDMEDCALTSITLNAFKTALSDSDLKSYDRFGIVIQAYLRRAEEDLKSLRRWAEERGAPISVRLVKGAYWDTETISAKQNHWPIPVWQYKECSDANYEKLSLFLLENRKVLRPAFGSHNVRSLLHATTAAELLGAAPTDFEIQTLYGMGESIAEAFTARGFLVRNYAPVGELIPGMGYLVRRLLENTSNEGFIRQSVHEQRRASELLKRPVLRKDDTGMEHLKKSHAESFQNVALRDFTIPQERDRLRDAVRSFRASVRASPKKVAPIIGGREVKAADFLDSVSPEEPALVVAKIGLATKAAAGKAIDLLWESFPAWRATPVEDRIRVLMKTATVLESRRADITAAIVLEAAKPWAEADADVAEAIDFLHYYSHQARSLFQTQKPGNFPGEDNSYFYEPRGITAVISPWNFPLAIPCGMFAAALVTGNCVALKPAEQTSYIASLLYQAFCEGGMPEGVGAFLPGLGEEVGPVLAHDPRVSTIVFTGSKEVGLLLARQGAESSSGAQHVKRVITEMGGKNAVIVDEDADFDEAVKGIVYSAFGYQGQKCSACSRAIIVGPHYARIVERLIEATKSIVLGPATEPGSFLGPVIDEESYRRILNVIEAGKKSARLLAQGEVPARLRESGGYYIPPTIFGDISPDDPLLRKEIFGPVLAVTSAPDFGEALRMANDSEYGLTGAVFSRSPKNIQRAVEEFRVGNLYINRGCTGALVMRQPFGGAKMSGVGSKAGGPDYLLQFVVPRAVTENTMRRGFAPSL